MIESEIDIPESIDPVVKRLYHIYIHDKKCDYCKTRDARRGLITFPINPEDKHNINKLDQLGIDFLDYITTFNYPRGAMKPICNKCDRKEFSKIQVFSGTHSMSIDFSWLRGCHR